MKPATTVAAILLFVVAVLHLLRLVLHVEWTINGTIIPMWVSIFGVLVPGGLAILMWRENRHG